MPKKSPYTTTQRVLTERLIELAARDAVLEGVLRHVTAVLFAGGQGGKIAFDKMRSEIMAGFQFNASAPLHTDDAVASEMQTQSIEFARLFLAKIATMRQEIADTGARH